MKQFSIYLAGIIQGSLLGREEHPQDYRLRLKGMLEKHIPGVTIYCPVEAHPNSSDYNYKEGKEVFFDHMLYPEKVDAVVAYVPTASMGTAIELWNGFRVGKILLVISPMSSNWVLKYLATKIFPTIEDFEVFLQNGGMNVFSRK